MNAAAKIFHITQPSLYERLVALIILLFLLLAVHLSALVEWAKIGLYICVLASFVRLFLFARRGDSLSLLFDNDWLYEQVLWQVYDYQLLFAGRLLILQMQQKSGRRKKSLWLWPDSLSAKARSELVYLLNSA